MAAYFIANYTVNNQGAYQKYLQLTGSTLEPFGAKILVAGGGHTGVEGQTAPIMVVLEFESREKLEGWYNSEAYQKVIHMRLENTDGWAIFADQWES